MRAHCLQHAPFEGMGTIEAWLRNKGYGITATLLDAGDLLPKAAEVDLLIIMGGPMSVNDEAGFPWLVPEKEFIRGVIDAGIPVLGVCLGAQLIANVMGSQIFPNATSEIGWYPIEPCVHDRSDVFCFPGEATVLHWHGETFDLPQGAVHLARSAACTNQAFQWGPAVIGLQFHLEVTPDVLKAFTIACAAELQPGTFVQTAEQILGVTADHFRAAEYLMGTVLDYLHAKGSYA